MEILALIGLLALVGAIYIIALDIIFKRNK